MKNTSNEVLLMFSGGRDSTLSALRLYEAGYSVKLVTITAEHLYGINSVEKRLREISKTLPASTEWLQIVQPALRGSQKFFHKQTCLRCQSAYVVTGATIARQVGSKKIAMGYAGYQAGWPEQGPQARIVLQKTLAQHGFDLVLPVYDIESRFHAIQELKARGISELALEQKCTRQVNNIELRGEELSAQLNLWGEAINEELKKSKLILNISRHTTLGDLQ